MVVTTLAAMAANTLRSEANGKGVPYVLTYARLAELLHVSRAAVANLEPQHVNRVLFRYDLRASVVVGPCPYWRVDWRDLG